MQLQIERERRADELAQLVGAALDEHRDGDSLARDANYSRHCFQRMFRQLTGETPGDCRRRLLLERAAHQLSRTHRPVTEIGLEAGFESLEGFSRAFRKVYGVSPSHYRRVEPLNWLLASPNDIHYDPVVGAVVKLACLDQSRLILTGGSMDLTDRLMSHDYWLTKRILERARTLSDTQLDAPMSISENPLPFESPEKTLRELLDRMVFTKEVWLSGIHGRTFPNSTDTTVIGMLRRCESAFTEFMALVKKVRDENRWDESFVDLGCDPPETFTYGGMIAHVVTFSAYRRIAALRELQRMGVTDLGFGDPIEWEASLAEDVPS